jgi:hypothetical protein
MSSSPELVVAILAFVAFSIPLISALWKLFAVREQLAARITSNSHRLELLEQRLEHLIDAQALTLNGMKELVQHVRDRSARAEEKLGDRLADTEQFLEKTTAFARRHTG